MRRGDDITRFLGRNDETSAVAGLNHGSFHRFTISWLRLARSAGPFQCSRHASGAIAVNLATFKGGGRSPCWLASRTIASRVGAAAAIAASHDRQWRTVIGRQRRHQFERQEAGDVAGVDPASLGALDHREDDFFGQLGGVGRVAGFMARVTE